MGNQLPPFFEDYMMNTSLGGFKETNIIINEWAKIEKMLARFKWHKVSDSLPLYNTLVLGYDGCQVEKYLYRGKDGWRSYSGIYDDITHWMPLPESPKRVFITQEEIDTKCDLPVKA